jgi:hypothetical protein
MEVSLMFDAASPDIETPAPRGPHLAEPVGRPQASTRPPGGGIRPDCQTLNRALDVVFMVAAEGGMTLVQLQHRLGLTKSTAYRLASALVTRGLLVRVDQVYALGPRWIGLAALAPDRAA